MPDARTTIGSHDASDWKITPTKPPPALEVQAAKLWARLSQSAVEGPAKRYEDADKTAIEKQSKFKDVARRANQSVLAVACLGAVTVAVGALDSVLGRHITSRIVVFVGVVGAIVGGLATMWLSKIREGKLLEEWMTNRALAETARIEYFDRVTMPTSDVELALLQLEYFRRYQLEVQLAFYNGRGKQHGAAAARTIEARTMAVFFGTVANALAGLLSIKDVAYSALGAGAAIASAVGAYATSAGATGQDGRNAERYARTSASLSGVQDRLDDVRAAVANGHFDVLTVFVKAVNDEVSLEHRQWLAQGDRYAGAMQDLETRLNQLKHPGAATEPAKTST